jgi:branched-chain amino acid transport system substrate-binding protein
MKVTREKAILILPFVVFSLVGPLILWLSNRQIQVANQSQPVGGIVSPTSVPGLPQIQWPSFLGFNQSNSISKRISLGDKVLITVDTNPDKQSGIRAFSSGQYREAIAKFNASLQINRNDPEARVYLGNAIAAASGNFVKIGVSLPIGENVNIAKEILRGVAQYQQEINGSSHQIQGKLLQVEIADDENDPEVAKQIATHFVKDAELLAVIGHQSSDASLAAAPIYNKGKVVMISPTSYARNLSNIGKYIYRVTPHSRALADALANHVTQAVRSPRVAICADTTAKASQSFQEDFTAAIYQQGAQITGTTCDFAAPDFDPSTIASQAVSDGANVLLLAPAASQIRGAIEIIKSNRNRLKFVASPSMYTFEVLQQSSPYANGAVLAVPWDPALASGSAYEADAKKLWWGSGNWRTAMAYDATKVIATGLSSGTEREQLQRNLANPGFSVAGATGVVQFLPTGDRNKPGTLVKVAPNKASAIGFSFTTLTP